MMSWVYDLMGPGVYSPKVWFSRHIYRYSSQAQWRTVFTRVLCFFSSMLLPYFLHSTPTFIYSFLLIPFLTSTLKTLDEGSHLQGTSLVI